MDDLAKDPRFAHVARDPKFKRIPKAERTVKIDKRFRGMFKDKKFGVKYTVDKRGRPVQQTSTENLKKYYDLSSSEGEDDSEDGKEKEKVKVKSKKDRHKKKSIAKNQEKHVRRTEEEHHSEDAEIDKNDNSEDRSDNGQNEDSDDNCFCSNGELLRIKPSTDCDKDTESSNESVDDDDKVASEQVDSNDEEENEKQLQLRRRNEKDTLTNAVKKKLKNLDIDYARGEGVLMTDSSSDDESSDYSDEGEDIEHDWGELDKEAETTEEATHRLALCNMDWDRIKAVDLLVLFNSFLPSGGLIHSVTIYPSEYGEQRMREEEIKGPPELVEDNNREENEDDEEGSSYHMEKLRQYQLNRLKYYYAVIVCDSAETANKIYTDCDGIEYESTAAKLDLRFIPNDMKFDQTPREVCDKLPELSKYQPRLFTTTALQQVKVDLTWDETNPERQEVTQKLCSGKLDEVDENCIQAYLASGTSDEDSDADGTNRKDEENDSNSDADTNVDPIEKYKSLLRDIEEQEEAKKAKEVELEFTWGLGTKEKTEKMVKERMKKEENLTPFEQYLEKRKAKRKMKKEEKKKLKSGDGEASDSADSIPEGIDMNDPYFKEELQGMKMSKKKTHAKRGKEATPDSDDERRKAELELLLMDKDDDHDKRHFNMKQIEEQSSLSKSKKKRLGKKNGLTEMKEDTFEVDVKDPRFNALYTSHHFNIDPADPHYRKTKGTEALVSEKLKRRATDDDVEVQPKQPKSENKLNVELQALIKSVKKNAHNVSQPIK